VTKITVFERSTMFESFLVPEISSTVASFRYKFPEHVCDKTRFSCCREKARQKKMRDINSETVSCEIWASQAFAR